MTSDPFPTSFNSPSSTVRKHEFGTLQFQDSTQRHFVPDHNRPGKGTRRASKPPAGLGQLLGSLRGTLPAGPPEGCLPAAEPRVVPYVPRAATESRRKALSRASPRGAAPQPSGQRSGLCAAVGAGRGRAELRGGSGTTPACAQELICKHGELECTRAQVALCAVSEQ